MRGFVEIFIDLRLFLVTHTKPRLVEHTIVTVTVALE